MITVETHEVWSAGREYVREKCTECDAPMITPEDAATIAGTCMRTEVYFVADRVMGAGENRHHETRRGPTTCWILGRRWCLYRV